MKLLPYWPVNLPTLKKTIKTGNLSIGRIIELSNCSKPIGMIFQWCKCIKIIMAHGGWRSMVKIALASMIRLSIIKL